MMTPFSKPHAIPISSTSTEAIHELRCMFCTMMPKQTTLSVPVLARLPIDPRNASLVDKGAVELADDKYIAGAVEALLK